MGPNGPMPSGPGDAPEDSRAGAAVRDTSRVPVVRVRVIGGGDELSTLEAHGAGATWCYAQLLYRGSEVTGTVSAVVEAAPNGTLKLGATSGPDALSDCVQQAAKAWRVPASPAKSRGKVWVSFRHRERPDLDLEIGIGRSAEIERLAERPDEAAEVAQDWANDWPADVAAQLALGRTLAELGRDEEAARAFGSVADWHPLGHAARADAIAWYRSGGNAPLSRRTFPRGSSWANDQASVGLYAYLLVLDGDPTAAFALLQDAAEYARLTADFGAIDTLEEDAARLATVLAHR
jgi:Flp pilus assembly protein TadD